MTKEQKIKLIKLIQQACKERGEAVAFASHIKDCICRVIYNKTRMRSYGYSRTKNLRQGFNVSNEEYQEIENIFTYLESCGAITKLNDNLHYISEKVLNFKA